MCLINQVRRPDLDNKEYYKFFIAVENEDNTCMRTLLSYKPVSRTLGNVVSCDNACFRSSDDTAMPRFGIIPSLHEAIDWLNEFKSRAGLLYKVEAYEVYQGKNSNIAPMINVNYPIGYACNKFKLIEFVGYYDYE